MDNPRISIVVAIGKNRELGKDGKLLWYIPEDLKRFKALTIGHPVIMGRKTFESIGKPLPDRTNIIISKTMKPHKGVFIASSVEEALKNAKSAPGNEEIFVIGGRQVYEELFTNTNRLYLTLIDDSKEADTYFPPYEKIFNKKISEENRKYNGLKYRWVTLEK